MKHRDSKKRGKTYTVLETRLQSIWRTRAAFFSAPIHLSAYLYQKDPQRGNEWKPHSFKCSYPERKTRAWANLRSTQNCEGEEREGEGESSMYPSGLRLCRFCRIGNITFTISQPSISGEDPGHSHGFRVMNVKIETPGKKSGHAAVYVC